MSDEYTLQNLPESHATEIALLGLMMISEPDQEKCLSLLTVDDFHHDHNRMIFRAILSCAAKDRFSDLHTVYEELVTSGLRPFFEVPTKLIDCVQSSYPGIDVEAYVEILREKRTHRELLKAGVEIVNETSRPVKNITETLERISKRIFSISKPSLDSDCRKVGEISKQVLENSLLMADEYSRTGKIAMAGVSTGYSALDEIIDGLKPGNLIVLAARTGVGKTAFAINLAYNISIINDIPSLFLSLEMGDQELIKRVLCVDSGVHSSKINKGILFDADRKKLADSVEKFQSKNMYVYEKSGLTLLDIRAKTRRMVETNGVKVLIIDYLQLITSAHRSDNRQTEVAEISRGLKILAKDLKIPIVCLAQLSRKTEERESKKPILSDLRESGAIEQDSDSVIFLSRPEIYDRFKKPFVMEVIVAKNRHGKTEDLDLRFDGETSRISSICYNTVPNYSYTDN